ncbi:MAG TPA: hypothetical protein VNW50_21870, partial [Streptosporangiaceae bacterium]|nr:hypothetical protein [Streptosporangiaceae bacterium]
MITARIAALTVAAATLASACTAGSGTPSAATSSASVTGLASSDAPAVTLATIPLVVPKSEDAAPFNKPRTLQVPPGW